MDDSDIAVPPRARVKSFSLPQATRLAAGSYCEYWGLFSLEESGRGLKVTIFRSVRKNVKKSDS